MEFGELLDRFCKHIGCEKSGKCDNCNIEKLYTLYDKSIVEVITNGKSIECCSNCKFHHTLKDEHMSLEYCDMCEDTLHDINGTYCFNYESIE